ncbi:MAG: Hsp20 family protein [Rhodospirillaceae bacterium]
MNTFDLTPLFRSTVGFDTLSHVLDAALAQADSGYPPYNIEKTGPDTYKIALAVAGFTADEIEMVSHEGVLAIRGKIRGEDEKAVYLYHGIASRAFERRFQLADYVEVSGARLENGLLQIELIRRVPEALKARRIEITNAVAPVVKVPAAEAPQMSKAA